MPSSKLLSVSTNSSCFQHTNPMATISQRSQHFRWWHKSYPRFRNTVQYPPTGPYCASSMTANRKEKESPHKAMIQDSAEWTVLSEYCAWILTQVHSNDCIAMYTDFMAQRQLLNHELQDMVRQVALHKAGKESTISLSPPRPPAATRGRKASRLAPPKTAQSQMNTLLNNLLALS
jgi:hypothetical protein